MKSFKVLKIALSVLSVYCINKAAAFPSEEASRCHCVLLKNCDSFTSFIDRTNNTALLIRAIQEAMCDFDGSQIYVCCPKRLHRKRHAKVKTKLDYLDEFSGLNCPRSFGKEYDYDEYLKEHESDEDDDSSEEENLKLNHNYSHDKEIYGGSEETKVYSTSFVTCDYLGNCAKLKFPNDDGNTYPQQQQQQQQQHQQQYHQQQYHTQQQQPPLAPYNYNIDDQKYKQDHNQGHKQIFEAPLVPFQQNYHHHQHHNHPYHNHHQHQDRPQPQPQQDVIRNRPQYFFFDANQPNDNADTCGFLNQDTSPTQSSDVYPWITRLAYLNTTSRTIRYRCLGTIISDHHVLTAAHCVDKLVEDLRLIYVRVGDDTNFDDFKIIESLIHPNYNEPLFNNDVALIKLAKTRHARVSFTSICLPQVDSQVSMGYNGIVAGWSEEGMSDSSRAAIRYINLPVMNNTECAIRYAKYSENFENSIVITPSEFCAQAEAMKDVCEGDSGGPFMERSATGTYILLGIVAFGPKTNCGQSNLPGVYMRVSSYVEWIQRNIV